jgi:host factor-I protein
MPFRGKENPHAPQKGRTLPAVETSQEAQYLKALGEKQTAVSIKLVDGEVVKGWIEYYDHDMLRLTRDRAPNLFIFKHDILYVAEDVT